jgi:integrase/recombinase XerD
MREKAACTSRCRRTPCVTHLFNHGADLHVGLRLLVGHSDISTTQVYTHVARKRLKALHAMHHPRG